MPLGYRAGPLIFINAQSSPLPKINTATVTARDNAGTEIASASIMSTEKGYFKYEEALTTTTGQVKVDGSFISLNKETNRGMFRMENGKSVKYHSKAEDTTPLHMAFALKGAVRVECIASLNNRLEVQSLDILSAENLQSKLTLHRTDDTAAS